MTAENRRRADGRGVTADGRVMPRGRLFQPGQSGNPGGRPKGLAAVTRQMLDDAAGQVGLQRGEEILVSFWIGILADPAADRKLKMQAAERLAERGWGRPATYEPIIDEDPLGFDQETMDAIVGEFDAAVVRLAIGAPADTAAGHNGQEARAEPRPAEGDARP